MPPPPRYTYHHHAVADRWYIYDRLLNHRVHIDTSALAVADAARAYETTWRTMCERWQWEEHQDSPPPSIS